MWRFLGVNIAVLIIWVVLIYKSNWNLTEKWTYIVGILLIAINLGILLFTGRVFNPEENRNRRLEKEKEKQYALNRFSMDEYERIKTKLDNAKKHRRQLL
jgi:hypothetical protein